MDGRTTAAQEFRTRLGFKQYDVILTRIPVAVTQTSDFAPVLSKEFLDIQATTKCVFTLKHMCDMIRTYSQMYSVQTSTHNTAQ